MKFSLRELVVKNMIFRLKCLTKLWNFNFEKRTLTLVNTFIFIKTIFNNLKSTRVTIKIKTPLFCSSTS